MIKEFCAENFTDVPKAIAAGASRIELCDNLLVGGTTPGIDVIEMTTQYAHEKQIPVMCMIRPRGGNFIYNDLELKIMETDILEVGKHGVDGVVFSALNEESWLDEEGLEQLLMVAGGMQVTFHMAFDQIPEDKQLVAIDWLASHNVTRILTHGGDLQNPISDYFAKIKRLVDYTQGKIAILAGGGITYQNFSEVIKMTGVKEVHGTKIVKF
ncbi:MAG: copper homeostasis protein CutC [Streptococcaceae bacterium]|nr:copper homeostasis protein CutC [Streptococcaceae bacterium]